MCISETFVGFYLWYFFKKILEIKADKSSVPALILRDIYSRKSNASGTNTPCKLTDESDLLFILQYRILNQGYDVYL